MGKIAWAVCLVLAALVIPMVFTPVSYGGGGKGDPKFSGNLPEHVEGEILVRFKEGVQENERAAHLAGVGTIAHEYARHQKKNDRFFSNLVLVKLPHGGECDCGAALDAVRKNPHVAYAEINGIVHADVTPNDPDFNLLWAANNTGQSGGTPNADIDLPEAWDITTGSSSVVVAVIDTGVDYNHQDLAANMWANSGEIPGNGIDDDGNGYIDDVRGWDWVNNDNDPIDDHYHGTHVSGTIAGVGNNGVGVTGVSWSSKIMALKFLNSSGSGSTANAVKAIQYATAKGVPVMSNSWGGGGYSQSLQDAITAANAAESNFVAAAGNNNSSSLFYPAAYAGVIAVAATDHNDVRASFSNFGDYVDVAAPGVMIYSSRLNNTYGYLNGTSMACPQVAGVCALLRGVGATRAQTETLVTYSADAIDSVNPDFAGLIGNGRVNAYEALTATGDTTPPTTPSLTVAVGLSGSQISLDGTASSDDHRVSCYRVEVSPDNVVFSSVPKWYHSFPIVVGGLEPQTLYYFRLQAYDIAGNPSGLSNVQSAVTLANAVPNTPTAPVNVAQRVLDPDYYTFTVSATDPDVNLLQYTIDWGDGTLATTSWQKSGATYYMDRVWSAPGTYAIRVMATDQYGAFSAWSAPLNFTVVSGSPEGNGVPSTPVILSSTTSIRVGDLAWFSVSSTDPEGSQIKWFADNGNGGISTGNNFVDGGQFDTFLVWYNGPGTYVVRFLCKDTSRGISDWSAPITVTVHPNQAPLNPAAPIGPSTRQPNQQGIYTFYTTDPDNDYIFFIVDWGDGVQESYGPYPSGTSLDAGHTWAENGTYNVRVQMQDVRWALSDWSPPLAVSVFSGPTAPSGLGATAVSGTQINLAWTDNSSNETGFKIERGTDGVNFNQIDTVGAGVAAYNNTGLTPGVTYYYRVRAYNGGGDSDYSNTANATTPNSTTVSFTSTGAHDGYVLESSETSNQGGTASATLTSSSALRTGDDNKDKQYKTVVSFDTSSIPDGATITAVTLKLKRGSLTGTSPFTTHGTCYADIKGGTGFGGATALATGDFQAAADATQVATMSNAVNNGDWSTGALNATGRSFVNKTGYTQFRVSFSSDDNDDTGNDYIGWYSGENSTSANRPALEVTYTLP